MEKYQTPIFTDKFVNLLFATLVMVSPKDTENMRNKIKIYYYGNQGSGIHAKIVISPGVPYARRTNEWNYPNPIRKDGKPSKQYYNWLWVDRVIKTTAEIIAEEAGGKVTGGTTFKGR